MTYFNILFKHNDFNDNLIIYILLFNNFIVVYSDYSLPVPISPHHYSWTSSPSNIFSQSWLLVWFCDPFILPGPLLWPADWNYFLKLLESSVGTPQNQWVLSFPKSISSKQQQGTMMLIYLEINVPSKYLCYVHRQILLSALIRQSLLYNEWR